MNDTNPLGALELRPLTARSIVLSTLLGHHPPRLPARALVRVGELFGVAEGTVRVALSRMVTAGDLDQDDRGYGLTARLLDRQARQDESRAPRLRRCWDGGWEVAVVAAEARPAADRAVLRRTMAGLRMVELREGTWVRPANLDRDLGALLGDQCTVFTEAAPAEDPAELVARLWNLPEWARRSRLLAAALADVDDLTDRFTVSAAALRHLLADPVLPGPLLPPAWPGACLRRRYDAFAQDLCEILRDYITPPGDPGE